jgi:ribonuclease BN (tRNA processing enzyme)
MAYVSDHGPIDAGPGPEGLGEYHHAIMELTRGVDLLIHDAQYTVQEFGPKAHFGHTAADYAVRLGIRAGVRRLLLFHHDPFHDDVAMDRIVEHCRELAGEADIEIEAAVEGSDIEV